MITIKIRIGMFETNSSSTHVISIPSDCVIDDTIPADEDGKIVIEPGSYQWEWEVYDDAYMKASYCLTYILVAFKKESDEAKRRLKMLEEVIAEQTGKEVVLITQSPDDDYFFAAIDHQSVDVAEPVFKDKETLRRFIFSRKAYLATGNDNEFPPADILPYFPDAMTHAVETLIPELISRCGYGIVHREDLERLKKARKRIEELRESPDAASKELPGLLSEIISTIDNAISRRGRCNSEPATQDSDLE